MTVLCAYAMAVSAAAGVRSPGRHVLRLAPIVVAIVVLNGVFLPGDPIVAVGGKTLLSRPGTVSGAFFSLRLLVLYFAMAGFVAATPPLEFASALYSAIRPVSTRLANRVAFNGFLVLSFVPFFSEQFERIRLAQSFRGADFTGGLFKRARAVRALVVPLVLSAVHRSGQLAAVIELRGLRDRVPTALPATKPGMADAVFVTATAVVLFVVVAILGDGIP
jgi:energy-coupling factor transporter transmembrane protein EcfT